MCGRYAVVSKVEVIEKSFNVKLNGEAIQPNPNIAVGELGYVITDQSPHNLQGFTFGFTPHFATQQKYIFNARLEGDLNKSNDKHFTGSPGIINKPFFRQSIRSKRCLVIANAYIEGPQDERLNKPHVVYKEDKTLFAFAGLWDEWQDLDNKKTVNSFAIITKWPNEITELIGHHRAPVILPSNQFQNWLNPNLPLSEVLPILTNDYDIKLNAHRISTDIKKKINKDIKLLKPINDALPLINHEKIIIKDKIELFGMGQTRSRKKRNEKDN